MANRVGLRAPQTYFGRLGLYAGFTLLCSMFGSTFTWRATSTWVDANPLVSGPIAVLSLLPALALLALVDLRWPAALIVAALAGLAITAFWWSFATSESSTAVLVFYWGWVAAIPLAPIATLLTERSQNRSSRQ